MRANVSLRLAFRSLALAGLAGLAACGAQPKLKSRYDRECMARAMYFESNRSSDEGMLAVGTVVMNRLQSGKYPDSVCGVVGQKKQFAPGVLSKRMAEGKSRERAYRMAELVLSGKRHRGVGNAMFFHTAGYNFPYTNMHYKTIAGGNAFYEKRTASAGRRNTTQREVAQRGRQGGYETPVQVANARPLPVRRPPPPAPPTPEWQEPAEVYGAAATASAEPAASEPGGEASIEALILSGGG